MASNNPSSFRVAFETQIAKLPAEVQRVHRTTLNAVTDLQQAISSLKSQIDTTASKVSTSTSSTSTTSSSSASAPVTKSQVTSQISSAISAATSAFKALFPGAVNNQTGVTAYTTVQTDYGALLLLNDASPVAVTLAVTASLPGITVPWYCAVLNEGTGVVTVTPTAGQINGGASIPVAKGEMAFVFFDGTNFWAGITAASGSGVTQIIAGTGISISPAGGTGNVTISLVTPVSIANGGTGTNSPSLVAGTNVTISGSWPNQTINASGGGTAYLKGTVVIHAGAALSGTFTGTGTVTGATPTMTVAASDPQLVTKCGTAQVTWVADCPSNDTVEVQVTFPNVGISWGDQTFYVTVFP